MNKEEGILRYQPQHCRPLDKKVWAILSRQADGAWRIANCLDKDHPCYDTGCALTTDSGQWPFSTKTPTV